MIDFSNAPCIYWSDSTKISYLQRRIIVWSLLYYEHDESPVPDSVYDSVSNQLVELQRKASKEDFKKSRYYYAMKDFDGSTGFDIPSRLTKEDRRYLDIIVAMVYEQMKRGPKRKEKRNDKAK